MTVTHERTAAWHAAVRMLHERYHRPELISPDPLELVVPYRDPRDREIAALICSSLALGRVRAILAACRTVLSAFPDLRTDLLAATDEELRVRFEGFVYRFFRVSHLVAFLSGIRNVLREYGTLEAAFLSGGGQSGSPETEHAGDDGTVLPALTRFVRLLREHSPGDPGMLLPDPERGSACKRLLLFLRWMVRRDNVDPGGWNGVHPSRLLVPMDTHLLQVSRFLGLTERRQADLRTAREVTGRLCELSPLDPARYDFALTRPGIRPELDAAMILRDALPNAG